MIEAGLIIVLVLAIAASLFIIRRSADRKSEPAEIINAPQFELATRLQDEARTLAHQGHTEEAIKHVRKQAKISAHEATLVVQALMVGRVFPDPETPATEAGPSAVIDDDLLTRLHALVAQDPHKRTAAIQLLRDRTGMNAREARNFVNAL
ncbi:hypothetical protein [Phytoactinopolyspora mesophila]|uniref:Ribosomal protein L7/L12 C-terminal domain-containing protein n=1 Tax=Phytoactinopolyspora mesophila TaxID=2650750 RepID=A0A7K3LZE2_9ACTN|nr:hypothetical protein [Phytoactinopolyspora mesophila]NDL56394.1 hypothetical protein [Phytoactinopolyspora mesophila]